MSKNDYWECPICHIRVFKSSAGLAQIEEHKKKHPKNQRAFTGATNGV